MNAAELLSRVQALGIRLSVQGDALAFEGRRETITPELLDQLRSCKPLLVALLTTKNAPDAENVNEWWQERAAILAGRAEDDALTVTCEDCQRVQRNPERPESLIARCGTQAGMPEVLIDHRRYCCFKLPK